MAPFATAFVSVTPLAHPRSSSAALPASHTSGTEFTTCVRPKFSPVATATVPRRSAVSSTSSPPSSSSLLSSLSDRAAADTSKLVSGLRDISVTALAVCALSLSTLTHDPSVAFADVPTEVPAVGVYDDAGVIPKGNASIFDRSVTTIEKNTGVHIHFVMVRTLPYGDSPNDYAGQLAKEWGLGNDDLLFVASTKLARAGVSVGGNVKLSEDVARSIAEETFGVPAGEERYGSALNDVSNRLIPVLAGEEDPGPPVVKNTEVVQTFKSKEETKNDRSKYIKVVGGVLVIAIVAPLIQTYWYVRDD